MKIVKKLFGLTASSSPSKAVNNEPSTADVVAIALGKKESNNQGDKISQAVASLPYGDELLTLVKTPNKYSKAALQNLSTKLDKKELELDQLKTDLPKLSDQLTVTSYCNDQSYSKALLGPLNNEATLVSLCEEVHSANLRQKLIEKLQSPDQLKRLEKAFKSRDKNSYKLIKQKLDALKQAEQIKIDKQQKLASYLDELRAHSTRAYNKDYKFKHESLERKFDSIFSTGPEDINQITQAEAKSLLQTCRAKIDAAIAEQAATIAAQQKQTEQVSNLETQVTQSVQIEQLTELITPLLSKSLTNEANRQAFLSSLNELKETITDLQARDKQEFVTLSEASEALIYAVEHDETLQTALNQLFIDELDLGDLQNTTRCLSQHCRAFSRSKSYKTAFLATDIGLALNNKKQALKNAEEKDKDENKHISGLIRKAQAAARDGHLKRAQGIRYSIEEKLSTKSHTPDYLQRQWEELLVKIENLGDWQSYAITPKLEALVNDMRALADSPKTVELQATQIKKLQSQWKDITKGSGNKHQALWEQFKSHSDEAYEICKQHYDQLDTVRAENTEKRQVLIQQLLDYNGAYNWESADWYQVEKVLSSAKKEWQNYTPSLRAKQKAQQEQFNAALRPIQNRLDEWYDKNKTEKERLIKSLMPLTTSDDLNHAIDIAIQFQKQWKEIGRCRRKDDDQLWKQFRGHCDSIFSKRDAERAQARAEVDERISAAESVLDQIANIIARDEDTFEKSVRDLDGLKEQLGELSELPKSKAIELDKKLRSLSNQAQTRLQSIHNRRKSDVWNKAFELKDMAINGQISTENMQTSSTADDLKQQPNNIQKALTSSLNISAHTAEDTESHYRQLCIRAEILNNAESPDEDKALRMQLQVKQLQSGFGQQAPTNIELAEQWLAAPSLAFPKYHDLFERFLTNCRPN